MPTPAPVAGASAAPAAETAYVASLFAHLQGKPHVLLPRLGHDVVPKPDGAPRLGTVLRRYPHIFHLHRVGASDAVSLVPGGAPPEPSRQPGRPSGQHSAGAAARSSGIGEEAAKLFWQSLTNDPDLRTRCSSRSGFSEEFRAWKTRQPQAVAGVPPAAAIFYLRRKKLIDFSGSDTISFATSRAAAAAKKLTESREQLESDKGSVTVSRVSFGTVRSGDAVTQQLRVRNEGSTVCSMRSAMLERGNTGFTATLAQNVLPLALQPGMETSVSICARPSASGMARDLFTLGFESESGRFTIGRFLEVRCGDVDLLSDLKPETPYRKPKRRSKRTDDETLQEFQPPAEQGGSRPAAVGPKLGFHGMPKEWKAALEQEDRAEVEETLANGQQVLEEATPETAMTAHAKHFHLLLWAEEWQLVLDLHNFDLVDDKATDLRVRGAEHILHVRGLAEKRPSVLRGDQVRANLPGERSRVWRGRAGQIEMEDVHLRFAPSFPYVDGQLVEISFMLGRTPLRLFHQGLDLVRELRPSILFPEPLRDDQLRAPREQRGPHQWFNPSVQGNPQQCMAVAAVVGGQGRHVPYIIFGPPGTGKTTTIVEAVLQCVRGPVRPPLRVLVAAPTNTAADVLCEKLSAVISDPMQMLRLMAYSRAKKEVSDGVLRFCRWSQAEGAFQMPELADISSKLVVVCTLSMAAKLHNQGLPRGHFDLVVVDEAGQALEPEAVAPVAALLGADSQLLLAGDPKQLGPVIHNDLAKANGLSTSLLERLMARTAYQRGSQNAAIQRALAAEAPPMVRPSDWPQGEARTFTFFHGTSWENALRIESDGFDPSRSTEGRLGPGFYVGRADKAIGFARSGWRHGGASGGLVEARVTIRNPKFISYEDLTGSWRAEGYDACRTEQTQFSTQMEWCIASPSQLRVVRITEVALDPDAHDAPPPGEDEPPLPGFDERIMTKLLRNFRSHAELLRLPNQLFYDNELLPCANPMLANSCLDWEKLPNPRVPMIFHGIEGKDERENNSPSWFNADEALLVLDYVPQHVKDLLAMRRSRCTQQEIGVITPYNKQMLKLQRMLKGADLGDVKVGSTELFQGQERRVIIISTVRSDEDFLGFDRKHNLGFLDNPKRFNVAITRAKALLIIVGNPAVLKQDQHWGALLRLAIDKGAYTGVPPPPDAPGGGGPGGDDDGPGGDDDALADRLEQMLIGAEPQGASEQMLQENMEMPDFGGV